MLWWYSGWIMGPRHTTDRKEGLLVYGAGAVGLGLGSFLISAGRHVVFLGRKQTIEALRAEGLDRTGIFGQVHHPPESFTAVSDLDGLPQESVFSTVLVTVKSYDLAEAARRLTCFLTRHPEPKPLVVLCQNGWGNRETFKEFCPTMEPALARVITGFERIGPHKVRVTVHADAMRLGLIDQSSPTSLKRLARLFNDGGFDAAVSDDIVADLWTKMLYNCALNPLSALLQTTYGRLGENTETAAVMKDVIEEAFAVMQVSGWRCRFKSVSAYWQAFMREMVPRTARHFSSMAQDLAQGRTTEIEALNGALVRLARSHGRTIPVNETLVRMIRFAEQKSSDS